MERIISEDKKNLLYIAYEIIMIVLALIVVGILGLELFFDFEEATLELFFMIDLAILIIFGVDYGIRISLAKDRRYFLKRNIWDLIAIIPFSSAFRAARVVRITRITRFARVSRFARMTRLLRTTGFLKRSFTGFTALLRTNNLHLVIVFTTFVILFGAIGMYQLEQGITVETFADSLWWSLVTTTTVGYGDISPATNMGRLLAAVLMLVGIGFVGMVTGTIATFFVNKTQDEEEHHGEDEIIEGIKDKLDRFDELSFKEIEEICSLLQVLKQD